MRLSLVLFVIVLALCSFTSFVSPANADTVSVTGSCPGDLEFSISGFESDVSVAVLMSAAPGTQRIPAQYHCAGTRLGLSGHQLRVIIVFQTDEFGAASYTRRGPRLVCGRSIQALSLYSCSTSNVAQIPE